LCPPALVIGIVTIFLTFTLVIRSFLCGTALALRATVKSTLFGEPSSKNTQDTDPLPNVPGRFYRFLGETRSRKVVERKLVPRAKKFRSGRRVETVILNPSILLGTGSVKDLS